MHVAHLPVLAGAWLLVAAGLNKLWRPEPTTRAVNIVVRAFTSRLVLAPWMPGVLGASEVLVGVGVLASHARAWTWALAVLYAAFAVFVVVALATGAPLQSCGCFGATDRAPSAVHVAVDAAVAAVAVATITDASLGVPRDSLVARHGLGAVASAALALATLIVLRHGRRGG